MLWIFSGSPRAVDRGGHHSSESPAHGPHHDRDVNTAVNIKRNAGEDQNPFGVAGSERTIVPVNPAPKEKG